MEKIRGKVSKGIEKKEEVMKRREKAENILARAKELTRKAEMAMKNGRQKEAFRAIQLAGKLALLATKVSTENADARRLSGFKYTN